MAFVMGPRQVGKTTSCRQLSNFYLNWDNQDHRQIIINGPKAVAEFAEINQAKSKNIYITLDEVHKYRRWKGFLKGFFDTYENELRIIVTGSSRLDVFRRGSDSLMGRYFLFHMHPYSVAESIRSKIPDSPISKPSKPNTKTWQALWEYGGFPEPFLRRDKRFSRRWHNLRHNQLVREDIRDLTKIQELDQLELLVQLLSKRSGQQLIYNNLANSIRVSENTIRRWTATLVSFQFGFLVRPWHKNISKALRKEPKWFLRDWSAIEDPGSRAETMIACHLLKSVDGWNDLGFGDFELRYVRDKQKREVDFLIVRDEKPWILVEVKNQEKRISPNLEYFQKQTNAPHAFQVSLQMEYIDKDCFSYTRPIVVSAKTFLSQLI
jgi:predicted AAA+ superfamily ATPase